MNFSLSSAVLHWGCHTVIYMCTYVYVYVYVHTYVCVCACVMQLLEVTVCEAKCLDQIKYRFQDGDGGKGATKERQKK